jgi:hypothetical protein
MLWMIGYPLAILGVALLLAGMLALPCVLAVRRIRTSKWWLRRVALSRFRMWAVL